jgi:hypothetical protein
MEDLLIREGGKTKKITIISSIAGRISRAINVA